VRRRACDLLLKKPRFGGASAIAQSPVIFPPRILLRVAEEVRSRNVTVDADRSASQAAEELLSPVSARAVSAIRLLMIDCFDLETIMQLVQ
jgi:hypothetical protein